MNIYVLRYRLPCCRNQYKTQSTRILIDLKVFFIYNKQLKFIKANVKVMQLLVSYFEQYVIT